MLRPEDKNDVVTGATSTEEGTEKAEVKTDASAETKKTEAVENKGGEHMIPKPRFDEVNNERKEWKREAEELRKQNEDLRKATQRPASEKTFRKFDDPAQQAVHDTYVRPVVEELETVKTELTTLREEREAEKAEKAEATKRELESELDTLQEKYPEMNRDEVVMQYSKNEDTLEKTAKKSHDKYQTKLNAYAAKQLKDYHDGKIKDADLNPPVMPKGGAPAAGPLKCPDDVIKQGSMAIFKWHEKNIPANLSEDNK